MSVKVTLVNLQRWRTDDEKDINVSMKKNSTFYTINLNEKLFLSQRMYSVTIIYTPSSAQKEQVKRQSIYGIDAVMWCSNSFYGLSNIYIWYHTIECSLGSYLTFWFQQNQFRFRYKCTTFRNIWAYYSFLQVGVIILNIVTFMLKYYGTLSWLPSLPETVCSC